MSVRDLNYQLFEQLFNQFQQNFGIFINSCDISTVMQEIRNHWNNMGQTYLQDNQIYIDSIKYTTINNEPYFIIPVSNINEAFCHYILIYRQGTYWQRYSSTYLKYKNGTFIDNPHAQVF